MHFSDLFGQTRKRCLRDPESRSGGSGHLGSYKFIWLSQGGSTAQNAKAGFQELILVLRASDGAEKRTDLWFFRLRVALFLRAGTLLPNDEISVQCARRLQTLEDIDHVARRNAQSIQPGDNFRQAGAFGYFSQRNCTNK